MHCEYAPGSRRVTRVTLRRPSNLHAHGRKDSLMQAVVPYIIKHMRYVLFMPNTGPIVTMEEAMEYYGEIMRIADRCITHHFTPIMTLYHTAETEPRVIEAIARSPVVRAVKHYPPHPGATTGSGYGIPLSESGAMLEAMQETGVPLLGHFEDVYGLDGRELDPLLREAHFVEHQLRRLRDRYPRLRICFEHASTRVAVEFVKEDDSGNTVMTVTPQHLLFTHDDLGCGFGVHLKCMPIVKNPEDRDAVLAFITSGDARAIAGDDTAPHPAKTKLLPFEKAANGCWEPHALALYARAFEDADALDDRFERFMSLNGPRWWGLSEPLPGDLITLKRGADDTVPRPIPIPGMDDEVIPLGWSENEAERFVPGWIVQ